jgi:transglutaminase-like putative cysteine protease
LADEPSEPNERTSAARTRTFRFTYAATVTGVAPGKSVRIWLPVPPSNSDQRVTIVGKKLPARERIAREPEYGNQILYVGAPASEAGTVPVEVTYLVERREVGAEGGKDSSDAQRARFLQPDAKVPLGGKPLDLVRGKELPNDQLGAARALYDVVNQHMRYAKTGTGWGQGDAVWACSSGYGNCSDFHSLFISLARSLKIPAKFEIGFPVPEKRGSGDVAGYHCWAKFWVADKGWVPVDISEANKNPPLKDYYFGHLTADRVAFSTGRDINLVPLQHGEPLNYFVYPYVEVDGKPYALDKIRRHFAFQDVPEQKR